MKKLPNFLIVGAAKSGTTSLHNYLNQHPEVFMPSYNNGTNVKEPQFFVKKKVINRIHFGIWSWKEYEELFKQVNNEKAIGEASVFYLYYYKEAIKNIHKYLGSDIKIIIILRNPIERAFSAYKHVSRGTKEFLSFERALIDEEKRLEEDSTLTPMIRYKDMGLYYNMVNAYMHSFKNVHVLLYDEFSNNTYVELKKIYNFLDIDDSVSVDYNTKYNVASSEEWNNSIIKSLILKDTLFKLNIKKFFSKKILTIILSIVTFIFKSRSLEIKESTKKELIDYFHKDIIKLSKLINKNLSLWLK